MNITTNTTLLPTSFITIPPTTIPPTTIPSTTIPYTTIPSTTIPPTLMTYPTTSAKKTKKTKKPDTENVTTVTQPNPTTSTAVITEITTAQFDTTIVPTTTNLVEKISSGIKKNKVTLINMIPLIGIIFAFIIN